MRALLLGFASLLLVSLLVGCGGQPSASPASSPTGSSTSTMPMASPSMAMGATPEATAGTISQTQTVGDYKLTLQVGPPEQMYTREQVAANHPADGEEMLSGQMTMPNASPMAGMGSPMASTNGTRHLELHVYDAKTGKTVTDATVALDVIDNSANNMSTSVPIATMQGVKEGSADFHYGNNVLMPPNRDYTVNATVNGQHASFMFHLGGM